MDNPTMLIAVGIGAFGIVVAVGMFLRELSPSTTEDRLAVLTGQKSARSTGVGGVVKKEVLQEGMSGVTNTLGKFAGRLGNVNLFFEQANAPFGFDIFLMVSVGAGVLGFALALAANAPFALWPICALFFCSNALFLAFNASETSIQSFRSTNARCHGTHRTCSPVWSLTGVWVARGGRRNARANLH